MIFTNLALAAVAMMAGVMATPTPVEARSVAAPPPAPSVLAANANATLDARDDGLEKRQPGAGVHLVNCGNIYSLVVYCPNDSNCGSFPAANNMCFLDGIRIWEGGNYGCTFPTGVTFSWNIRSDAQQQPNFSQVGTGNNGQSWRIFKDNKHVMFRDGNNNNCLSIYYSLS